MNWDRLKWGALLLAAVVGGAMGQESTAEIHLDLPQPLGGDYFADVFERSPFTRTLGVADSLILTGIARLEGEVFATLLDTKTMESQMVSSTANAKGWTLVGLVGQESKLDTLSAKVQVPGGEVVSIRYQVPPKGGPGTSVGGGGPGRGPSLKPAEEEEARKAAKNYKEGFSSDGFPREPPREVVEKLSRLSTDQRETINRQMIGLRNRGLGMEERQRIYVDMVNRSAQGGR